MNKKYLKLKYLREKAGYTQLDFALKIGVTTGQYSKKENGTQPWRLDECEILRDLINKHLSSIGENPLPIDDIFLGDRVSKTRRKKTA